MRSVPPSHVVLLVVYGVAAIASAPPHRPVEPAYKMQTPFNPAQHEAFRAQGEAVLRGQAFLKTRGGDSKKCAGETVYLLPKTAYFDEWYQHVVAGEVVVLDDITAAPFIRRTTGDADGRFEFRGAPAGDYYVSCKITWEVPEMVYTGFGYTSVMREQGGTAVVPVALPASGEVNVIVTR